MARTRTSADASGPGLRSPQRPRMPLGPWMRRFLGSLALTFLTLTALAGAYGLWAREAVILPAWVALDSDGDRSEAFRRLRDSHLFGGYEAWHGFGTDEGRRLASEAERLVARPGDYSERETAWLVEHAAFWIPAFAAHRLGGSPPPTDGDEAVLRSLLARWENGNATLLRLVVHLALVSLIVGGVYALYRRMDWWDRPL